MILFVDCETNGFASGSRENTDPKQPHIVELAATLVDRQNVVLGEMCAIVRPDGWDTGDADCVAVHGITLERAREEGIAEYDALKRMLDLAARSSLVVAHNTGFDVRIIEIALSRHLPEERHGWLQRPTFCTMTAGRSIGVRGKLAEMYAAIVGQEHGAAHTALGDVDACRAIFFEIVNRGLVALPEIAAAA